MSLGWSATSTATEALPKVRVIREWCSTQHFRLTSMQHNKLGVALANKLARIVWSVLNSGKDFDWKEKEMATAI
ncbi:hypothetical protein ACFFUT_08500 [Pseudohalocynthiibacter aestuariivivens]|uniref:IS110 family transposase n=1 Tax=Pseudohalocynthiibacter aestuariivivens TaxID=1591409 RepID=A0ABV5JEG0_9RHOB